MKKQYLSLVVISVFLILSLSACGVVKDISAVNQVGEAFMVSLRDNNPSASWTMLVADVQDEVGSEEAWQEFVAPRNFSDWSFSNTQVENDTAQMDGEATLGVDTYTVVLVFQKEGDAWKISGITFTFKE